MMGLKSKTRDVDVTIQRKISRRLIRRAIIIALCAGVCAGAGMAHGRALSRVVVASYNVENLFDLKKDSGEYAGYIPGGAAGWDQDMLNAKLSNLARVIQDLDADVLALQEIESRRALKRLNQHLEKPYPHSAIADHKPTTVKCALLSRYPIKAAAEIAVPGTSARNILKVRIDIAGDELIVFVNHWKSKSGPESERLPYARSLADAIDALDLTTDFVVLGDLNANYNEFQTFEGDPKLNDTSGITGINHILNTVRNNRLVSERQLNRQTGDKLRLYNLWLELIPERRWSTQFFRQKNSHDHLIVSPGLYDDQGVSYIDNSFDKFDPGYLFSGGRIKRWQREDQGRGRHLGQGFSDHLPVFAWFAPQPFKYRRDVPYPEKTVPIDALYESKTGRVNYHLRRCAVIYKHKRYTVVKQPAGRAILVYGAGDKLARGHMYHLTVQRLKRYYGMLEITELSAVETTEKRIDVEKMLLAADDRSLGDPGLINEVVRRLQGVYQNGWLHYGDQRKIRLYARDKALLPESGSRVIVNNIRIGFHDHPELVLEQAEQLELLKEANNGQ